MNLRALLFLIVAVGSVMMISRSYRDQLIMRGVSARMEGADRFVDTSVVFKTVVADPNGDELIAGAPRMRVLPEREREFGGIYDTQGRAFTDDVSSEPLVWYVSEDQERALFHGGPQICQLIYGSEGAGKTRLLCMWHYLQWIRHIGEGREGGQTAPTIGRLGLVKAEMESMYRTSWGKYVSRELFEGFEFCDGTSIRFRYSHQQSQKKGAPIQGYNWSWCGRDEMQDQVDAHPDIQARGRKAKRGMYYQLGTATAKDDPSWRTLRDQLEESGLWVRRTLLGPNSPFVWPSHWDAMKATMSEREYNRRVLAMDLPPETATYPTWSRAHNLITVQDLGWTDVTRHELRGAGPNYTMLVGHDPGMTVDVSLFLRAFVNTRDERNYHLGSARPFWVVLGELNTEQSTTEHHIQELLKLVRDRWQLNLMDRNGRVTNEVNQILVHADPAGESDTRTDKSVYTQFANARIRCKPAAYNKDHTGHGRVPREPAVEMVNSLFCNALNERRLFVAKDERGLPAAPKLVAAIESAERDAVGRAEVHATKGRRNDMTHWPAALRYALWPIERPRLQLQAREEV